MGPSEKRRPAHVLPALLRPAAALGGAGADKVKRDVGEASENLGNARSWEMRMRVSDLRE
jgi:hypothetical protein